MSLASLSVSNLRCISKATLAFEPRLNLLYGANGSGKTSFLEAIFLIGRGRSFRTRQTDQLISKGEASCAVFAQTVNPLHRIGFEYQRGEAYVARLDGNDVRSLAELPSALFVEIIDPEIHRLVDGAPGERRRWLDWGTFHVEHSFLQHWLRFSRALRQRNASLKEGSDPQIWEGELTLQGEQVALYRDHWFQAIRPSLENMIRRISDLDVELTYYRGWSSELSLGEALSEGRERDKARGGTLSGPHRADVLLRVSGRPARERLSRGQQKLVAAAMVLALLAHLRGRGESAPTLLLDDPAAELDSERLSRLVEVVRELSCQLIITSLNPDLRMFGQPERVFHVERGSVQGL